MVFFTYPMEVNWHPRFEKKTRAKSAKKGIFRKLYNVKLNTVKNVPDF